MIFTLTHIFKATSTIMVSFISDPALATFSWVLHVKYGLLPED